MGSCVSSHKHTVKSDIKFDKSFGSQSNKLVHSPIKDNKANGEQLRHKSQPDPSQNFPDLGSKEETFFDSQAWLDSDCDDDFMSVNGEFTPCGNTPLHHSFAAGAQIVNKALLQDPAPGPVPEQASPKIRLSDLFKQSIRVKHEAEDEQNTSGSLSDTYGTSSLQSSEQTPNTNVKDHREKSLKSFQCCLPNMTGNNNYSDGKNMRGPVQSIV